MSKLKKTAVDAAIGREQAKQYCYNIQKEKRGELPFCFYTNGYDIFFWDLDNYPPKKIYDFPTREDLDRYAYIRKTRKALAGELINTKIAGRDFQISAIRSVIEAVEKRKRKFFLVMATGTGKTKTCIALVDALMRLNMKPTIRRIGQAPMTAVYENFPGRNGGEEWYQQEQNLS